MSRRMIRLVRLFLAAVAGLLLGWLAAGFVD
jgi:hypothetical protein